MAEDPRYRRANDKHIKRLKEWYAKTGQKKTTKEIRQETMKRARQVEHERKLSGADDRPVLEGVIAPRVHHVTQVSSHDPRQIEDLRRKAKPKLRVDMGTKGER